MQKVCSVEGGSNGIVHFALKQGHRLCTDYHRAALERFALTKEPDGPLTFVTGNADRPERKGGCMTRKTLRTLFVLPLLVSLTTIGYAQSFRVQCPTSTITHPSSLTNVNAEPAYNGATGFALGSGGYFKPTSNVNGAIRCQQISGGDGYATMGDGTQTYMFSFGPLSGVPDIAAGKPGTEFPNVFNTLYAGVGPVQPGYPNCDSNTSATY